METKFRVTMRNNSDARALDDSRSFGGVSARCRHNGGKVVIMVTSAPDSLEAALDASHAVVAYAVVAS